MKTKQAIIFPTKLAVLGLAALAISFNAYSRKPLASSPSMDTLTMSQVFTVLKDYPKGDVESNFANLAMFATPAGAKGKEPQAGGAGIASSVPEKTNAREEDVKPAKPAEKLPGKTGENLKRTDTPPLSIVPQLGEKQVKTNDIDKLGYDIQNMNLKDSAGVVALRARLDEMANDTAISNLGLVPVLNIVIETWNGITGESISPVGQKNEVPDGKQEKEADSTGGNRVPAGSQKSGADSTSGGNAGNGSQNADVGSGNGNSGGSQDAMGKNGAGNPDGMQEASPSEKLASNLQQLFTSIGNEYNARIGNAGLLDSATAMRFAKSIAENDSVYAGQLVVGSNEYSKMASLVNMLLSIAPYDYGKYNGVLGKYASPLMRPKKLADRTAETGKVNI